VKLMNHCMHYVLCCRYMFMTVLSVGNVFTLLVMSIQGHEQN